MLEYKKYGGTRNVKSGMAVFLIRFLSYKITGMNQIDECKMQCVFCTNNMVYGRTIAPKLESVGITC